MVALLILSGQSASAQGTISSPSNVPSSGTANSVFRFSIQYSDSTTPPALPTLLELHIGATTIDFPLGDARFQKRSNLSSGVEFYLYASGGLDQKNQFPGGVAGGRGTFLPDAKVFYVPDLRAKGGGDPNDEIEYWWHMEYPPTTPGGAKIVRNVPSGTAYAPTIYDSSSSTWFDAYNGVAGGSDWMYAFPDGWPFYHYIDPLDVTNRTFRTPGEDPTQFPDEGSSTSTYTFGVTYKNERGLRARAWMLHDSDYWNPYSTAAYAWESGVMLYIRNLDYQNLPNAYLRDYWRYFKGHHMYKEDWDSVNNPCDYVLRVGPDAYGMSREIIEGSADHWMNTLAVTARTGHYYEALPPGRYEYYFACSDDDYSAWTIDNDKDRIWPQLEEIPPMPTAPAPNDYLFWAGGLNYRRDDGLGGRTGSYVDKTTYMPGAWMSDYAYDSWVGSSLWPSVTREDGVTVQYPAYTYPIVNPGLFQIGDYPIGGSRFLGTLSPYKRAVNPTVPGQEYTNARFWAETAGGTIQDVFTFKVNYWQSAGIAPSYVALYIKNGWNADDGVPFRYYPMQPSPGQTLDAAHYKTGVTYECRSTFQQLGRGPHCYYFEAADAQWTDVRYGSGRPVTVSAHVCRYPRRPDSIYYNQRIFYELTLPAKSPRTDMGDQSMPVENDIINGPYINTAPEVVSNSWSVSPTSGPSGTNFRFRITYRDADNQRPYAADVIVEADDVGTTFTGSMSRTIPRLNPDGTSADPGVPADNLTRAYSDGVVYEWNTSSAPSLRLQIGLRNFRFAFIDNWGSPVETDDNISGETVYAPVNASGWAGSFRVTSNSAPKLLNGSVRSADGTSNDATTWNYSVTYKDADNQSPQYILVFIGHQNQPGDSIIWDSGHAMDQVTNTEYNNGAQFSYSTRLPGNSTTPIKYYHCFVASDGVDVADYNATTSPSAGTVWKTAETLAATTNPLAFTFAHNPLVTAVPPSSEFLNPTNYVSPLIYNGTTLLTSSQYTLNNLTGTVTLSVTATPPVSSKYWFGTEPGSNGPGAVGGNNAPTLEGGQVNPAKGLSTTMFTYSVTYKDIDGQQPQFINVVIDGNTHPMTSVSGGTTYKEGVSYTYSTTLSSGNHSFYFEASDGSTLAIFEADPSTEEIDPIEGPYINDHPTFSLATISPSGSVSTGQAITYSITYRDNDNEGPNSGYPIVYIDNPTEQDWVGTAGAVGDDFIKSSNPTENWTLNQFAGMPVQVTLAGTNQRIVYKILSNTTNQLTLVATDVSSVVTIGSEFDIGKLLMGKQDLSDQIFSDPGGVIYEAKVPSLGPGTHKAHFKSVTTETTMPGQTEDYTLRFPTTGDTAGPNVDSQAPAGNVGPTLTNGGSAPVTGTSGTPFRFAVTYTDANGNAPNLKHDEVVGYINLVIEETPGVWTTKDMTSTEAAPSYSLGAEFAYTLTLTTVGAHQYYFDASDGWVSVRLPSSGYYNAYISRPPILTQGLVTPTSSNTGRVFEYKVKYTDPDNNPPASIKLYVDGNSPIEISVPQPGANYANGVVYSYPTTKGSLAEGLHTFYFTATDGYGYAWYDQDVRDMEVAKAADPTKPDPVKNGSSSTPPTPIVPINGPSVHSNTAPELPNSVPDLVNADVSPVSGYPPDSYDYFVTYRDADNDEPEFVEVYIDGTDSAHAHRMDPVGTNLSYTAGVRFKFTQQGLNAGVQHSFFFKASDWLSEDTTPTANNRPIVNTSVVASISLSMPAPNSGAAGNPVHVGGYITYNGIPLSVDNLILKLTNPDGAETQVTLRSSSTGFFEYTWTPTVIGVWTLVASWAGDGRQYESSTSPAATYTAKGPTTKINGLDMISVPLAGISIFPDGVFGADPPFALAKWLPTQRKYKLYSLLPGIQSDFDFPSVATGQAYWIKTLVEKTIEPPGSIVDATQDYSIPLTTGWNQIGCPFNRDVEWGSLRVRYTVNGVTNNVSLADAATNGWVKDYGWTYDKANPGNYALVRASTSTHTLIPWKGYWLKANVSCALVVPGFRGISAQLTTSSLEAEAPSDPDNIKWQVTMTARNGELNDKFNYFGASRLGDERIESPGCFGDFVDLYFTTDKGGMYAGDLRGNLSTGDSWLFNVDTNREGEVVLDWNGLEKAPAGIKMVLADLAANKSIEITPGGSYRFRADAGGVSRSFRIDYQSK